MSFLDVLDSIGTGQRPAPPAPPQAQRSSNASTKPARPSSNPKIANPSSTNSRSSLDRVQSVLNVAKRKVDDAFAGVEKPSQPPIRQTHSSGIQNKTLPLSPPSGAAYKNVPARTNSPASSTTPAKAPPKGSFAALMAEAKAAQERKAQSQVGLIKHQPTQKEKLSRSERKKREEEEKAMKAKLGKQPQHNSKVEKKAQLKPKQRVESSYKGTAKPAAPVSSYKGTAGLPSKHKPFSADARNRAGKQSSRYDEYLGTDEEDEPEGSEVDEGDDGYGSDATSDMEAGVFDVEEEESRALQEAKVDDARELALENKLKREKEERKRKLEALAKKRR